jgi:hypothetical protein
MRTTVPSPKRARACAASSTMAVSSVTMAVSGRTGTSAASGTYHLLCTWGGELPSTGGPPPAPAAPLAPIIRPWPQVPRLAVGGGEAPKAPLPLATAITTLTAAGLLAGPPAEGIGPGWAPKFCLDSGCRIQGFSMASPESWARWIQDSRIHVPKP